jgi:hypothetical protein
MLKTLTRGIRGDSNFFKFHRIFFLKLFYSFFDVIMKANEMRRIKLLIYEIYIILI